MGSAEHPLSRLRTRLLRCASVWRHLMRPGVPGSRAGLCRDTFGGILGRWVLHREQGHGREKGARAGREKCPRFI